MQRNNLYGVTMLMELMQDDVDKGMYEQHIADIKLMRRISLADAHPNSHAQRPLRPDECFKSLPNSAIVTRLLTPEQLQEQYPELYEQYMKYKADETTDAFNYEDWKFQKKFIDDNPLNNFGTWQD